ncbi:MAG: glycosyltransferase [Lachnospiraceae bacterium]|nr:glycosyltransferase [Lachnospiraceae bacterium]
MSDTILFIEWKSFGNEHIIPVFESLGYGISRFAMDIHNEDTRNSEELAARAAQKILEIGPVFVFSFNYYPAIAIACKACRVKYVSWIYDSPFIQVYSQTALFDTNRIFHFDSTETQRLRSLGVQNINYLPMGAALEHYDKVEPTAADHKEFDSDITFIGSTYSETRNHMFRHLEKLDDNTRGYVDGLINAQLLVYGMDIIEPALTQPVMEKIQKVCPVYASGDGLESAQWVVANYFLARKVTAIERQKILSLLSESFKVRLFTPEKTPELPKVINMGKIDYYDRAPAAMKCAKINLNMSLRSIHSGMPLRALDILGCGGFLLTNYQSDFLEYLEPGVDFVYYDSIEDAKRLCEYYLEHEDERRMIAKSGYEKVKQHLSYRDQVLKMLESV